MRTLIKIRNFEVQDEVHQKYGIKVPLYMVFCTEEKFYNSPLWFEMWSDKEYID